MATEQERYEAFVKRYPTRSDKERALDMMSDDQIDRIARGCPNHTGKAVIASFKSKNRRSR